MKKEIVCKVLYALSVLLLVGFLISLVSDYMQYNTYLNSAPFYIFVLVRAVEFILPGIMVFIVVMVMRRKINK